MPRLIPVAIALTASLLLLSIYAAGAFGGSGGINPEGESDTANESNNKSGSGTRKGDKNKTPRRYKRHWSRVDRKEKRWARRVAECESGIDPNATALDGEYRGAFMFTQHAWKTSPKSPGGDPINYSYKTQAVVAVALKKRDGTRPWPACG